MNTAGGVDWRGPAIVLRAALLPQPADSGLSDVFGRALPFRTSGVQVFIYYDRVMALSRLTRVPLHSAFAAAFTHEIGHMLLRSTEHALSGIMRAEWGGRELEELGCNRLRFTPQERSRMRHFALSAADQDN
jgi:hypothetical protein